MHQNQNTNDKLALAINAETNKQLIQFGYKSNCANCDGNSKALINKDLPASDILVIIAAGIPSSGYMWILENGNADILELIAENLEYSDIPGATASKSFIFKGVAKGSAALKFVYKRPWENSSPLNEYDIIVASQGEYAGAFNCN